MDIFMNVLRNHYADFSGRATRREYFMFALFQFLIGMGLILVGMAFGKVGTALYPLFMLGTIVPTYALYIRRLHDVDKSGWWCLIPLVPILGGIYVIILVCTAGTPGPNRFGPDPYGSTTG